jgi:hypothetical protein
MALEANCILIRRRPKLAYRQRTVRIVAIGALDEALIHRMMEGFLEVGFLFGMAGEAQSRLLLNELIFQLRVMHGVAGCTGDATLVMSRAHEFALLGAGLMASQTAPADIFRTGAFEGKYLGLVASAFDMRRAGTMARLAAVNLFATNLGQVGPVMRTCFNILELIFVAALAGIRAHELRLPGGIGRDACYGSQEEHGT